MSFVVLFVTLPTKAGTGRVRALRALKALGCAALRDGVHLLPEADGHAAALEAVAVEVAAAGGSAEVFRLEGRDARQEAGLEALFDRTANYGELVEDIRHFQAGLEAEETGGLSRRLNGLSRRLEQIAAVDFFPGETGRQARAALEEAKSEAARILSPDEPSPVPDAAAIPLSRSNYQGRTWATRKNLWVDRMASAWLIRRHIDPDAAFVWLESLADCRHDWLGFDFDGAPFSHIGSRVTFETLLASFGLDDDPALTRIGEVVHFLDVGGLPVPEARGVEAILVGLRQSARDDDRLLNLAATVFDSLQTSFEQETTR